MADKHPPKDPVEGDATRPTDLPADGQEDAEGHMLMPNIAAARLLANSHTREAARDLRVRGQNKEGRPGEKRSR